MVHRVACVAAPAASHLARRRLNTLDPWGSSGAAPPTGISADARMVDRFRRDPSNRGPRRPIPPHACVEAIGNKIARLTLPQTATVAEGGGCAIRRKHSERFGVSWVLWSVLGLVWWFRSHRSRLS